MEKINLQPLKGKIYPVEKAKIAYNNLIQEKDRPLSVIIEYKQEDQIQKTKRVEKTPLVESTPTAVDSPIKIGLIGAGNYARSVLLPILHKTAMYRLWGVADSNGLYAKKTADIFDFK